MLKFHAFLSCRQICIPLFSRAGRGALKDGTSFLLSVIIFTRNTARTWVRVWNFAALLILHGHRTDTEEASGEEDTSAAQNRSENAEGDRWALGYISLDRVRPILEAFDDDNSGFISIWEANHLTSSRPKDWRSVSLTYVLAATDNLSSSLWQHPSLVSLLGRWLALYRLAISRKNMRNHPAHV